MGVAIMNFKDPQGFLKWNTKPVHTFSIFWNTKINKTRLIKTYFFCLLTHKADRCKINDIKLACNIKVVVTN